MWPVYFKTQEPPQDMPFGLAFSKYKNALFDEFPNIQESLKNFSQSREIFHTIRRDNVWYNSSHLKWENE